MGLGGAARGADRDVAARAGQPNEAVPNCRNSRYQCRVRRESPAALGRLAVLALAFASLGFVFELEIARLRAAFEAGNPPERHAVIRRARRVESTAILPLLREALADEESSVSLEAADALLERRDEASLEVILEWLGSTDEAPRILAIRAVGRFRVESERATIERMLADRDAEVRRAVIDALDELGNGGPALCRALGDTDANLRVAAAEALGRLADPATEPALVGATRDVDARVRAAAIAAVSRIPGADATTLGLAGLEDRDADVVESSVRLLGRSGSVEVVPALAAELDAEDTAVAIAAVFALANLDRVAAAPALAERLDDARLSNAIVRALSSPTTEAEANACVHAMIRASTDESVRGIAERTLLACARASRLDDESERAIVRAAHARPSPALAAAVSRLRDPDAARVATALAVEDELDLSLAALRGLAERTPDEPDGRVVDPLVDAIPRFDAERRVLAYRILGRAGSSRALPSLRRGPRDEGLAERDARFVALATLAPADAASAALSAVDRGRYGDPALADVLCRAITTTSGVDRLLGRSQHAVVVEALGCGLAAGRPGFVERRAKILETIGRALSSNDSRSFGAAVEAALRVAPTLLDPIEATSDPRASEVRAARRAIAESPCGADVPTTGISASVDPTYVGRSLVAVYPDGTRRRIRVDARARLPLASRCAVAIEADVGRASR